MIFDYLKKAYPFSEYYETLLIFLNNEMLSLEAFGWNKEHVSAFRQYSGPFDHPEKLD
jgi:hypothetical protein